MANNMYLPGMDYGVGLNSVGGEILGDAVEVNPATSIEDAGGAVITFKLSRIESIEDLKEELGLSVAAEGSYGCFSASAKFDYATTCNFHAYSLYVLVHVSVTNSFRRMRNVRLKSAVFDQLKQTGDQDRFRQQYGDKFVLGIHTGGELFAILEIQTRDASEQQKISAELTAEADSLFASFSIAAKFEAATEHVQKNRKLRIFYYAEGGDQKAPIPTTPQALIARAVGFPAEVKHSGVPYSVLLQSYKALDMPAQPNESDIRNQQLLITTAAKQRDILVEKLNSVDYILTHPEQFEEVNDAKITELNKARNSLSEDINNSPYAGKTPCRNKLG
jgi:hypothetical protein